MIADINTPVRAIVGKTSDSTYQVPRLDPDSHSLQTIDIGRAEIHHGHSFEYRTYVDLALNNVWDIQITTPNRGRRAHFSFEFDVESETLWHFYENVNIILAGAAIVSINHDRISSNESILTMAGIANANVGAANADTAVAGATVLAEGIAGGGKKVGGEAGSRHGWPLARAEDYCLRFIATVAGFVSYHLDYYEHPPKGN